MVAAITISFCRVSRASWRRRFSFNKVFSRSLNCSELDPQSGTDLKVVPFHIWRGEGVVEIDHDEIEGKQVIQRIAKRSFKAQAIIAKVGQVGKELDLSISGEFIENAPGKHFRQAS